MDRTITVKGTGKLSLKPDEIVISLSIRTLDPDYDKSMAQAAERLEKLRDALIDIGFRKDDLKSANFNVSTEYTSERDENGNYRQVFSGYRVCHQLKLEFGFDSLRLSRTLSAIAGCIAEPELDVRFTVKDREAVNAALLESASINARSKAEILAKASGVVLKCLLSINYNMGDLNLDSPTRLNMEDRCMLKVGNARGIEVVPQDIEVRDSVTFIWAIE